MLCGILFIISPSSNMCNAIIAHGLDNIADVLFRFGFVHHLILTVFLKCLEAVLVGLAAVEVIGSVHHRLFPLGDIGDCIHVDRVSYIQIHAIYLRIISLPLLCITLRHIQIIREIASDTEEAKVAAVGVEYMKSAVRSPVVHYLRRSVLIDHLAGFRGIVLPIAKPTLELLRFCDSIFRGETHLLIKRFADILKIEFIFAHK